LTKGPIHKEDIIIINIFYQISELINNEANIDRIEGRNSSTVIVGNFNGPLSIMDRITT
jgi:ribosomal protein S28E/S33